MKIIPRGPRVVLKPIENENSTLTGIYIPNKEHSDSIGEVLALGDKNVSDLKVGDRVIYLSFAAAKIKNFDDNLVIIDEKDILGICK